MRVRTTMLSLLKRKFLRFSSCKISITLLIFPECRGLVGTIPSANITNKSKPPPLQQKI